jgi:transposase, IS5 family
MRHALVLLGQHIDWGHLESVFGSAYTDKPGHQPLPTRLMAGLAILKHMHNLSDEGLCDLWVENPDFQQFSGEEFFQHKLPFDRSSITRWRQRMGEDKLTVLLQESLAVAVKTKAAKPFDPRFREGMLRESCHRHNGAAQERDVPDRCQTDASRDDDTGAYGEETWR